MQHILLNRPSIPDPYAKNIKIMDVFVNVFTDKKRIPIGIQVNLHLLLHTNTDIIPAKYRRAMLEPLTKTLAEIATQYTSKQLSSSI